MRRRASFLVTTGRRAGAVDTWLLRRAVASRTPARDAVLLAASRAADKSRLWLVVAAAMAVFGGSRGRRAATRGLLSVGLSSAVVNGPLKLALHRKRPAAMFGERASLIAMPRSFSFPSGHAASAFAFATGAGHEWPALAPPVVGAAAAVAYSRVHTGVHYPGDVLVGAGLGVLAGITTERLMRDDPGIKLPPGVRGAVPTRAVLLTSANSGSAGALDDARAALQRSGIEVVDEIPLERKGELAAIAALPAHDRPLVIAAGGDGTVGAAADELSGTDAVLAILPLGTSNDVARSLGISPDPVRAAGQIVDGVVRAIDVGQVVVSGERPRDFVHAATVGLNVHFAELATASSLRRRFGRLTYAVAGVRAIRQHQPFECELRHDGTSERLRLVQLSVVNAPVFGGFLDLRVPDARMDDRSLLVIAVEDGSPVRLVLGALLTLVARRPAARGVRVVQTRELSVHVDTPVDVALDGEITTSLPADFDVAAEALRVVTPAVRNDRA